MDVKRPVIADGEAQGLSDSVAAERLAKEGPNELPAAKPKSALAICAEVVSEPMFLLLIATGTVYLVLGSVEEAVALGVSIFVIIGITLYQQTKTERTWARGRSCLSLLPSRATRVRVLPQQEEIAARLLA